MPAQPRNQCDLEAAKGNRSKFERYSPSSRTIDRHRAIVKSKIVECLDRVFDWPSVTSNWTSWPARPRYGAAILEVTSVALAGK